MCEPETVFPLAPRSRLRPHSPRRPFPANYEVTGAAGSILALYEWPTNHAERQAQTASAVMWENSSSQHTNWTELSGWAHQDAEWSVGCRLSKPRRPLDSLRNTLSPISLLYSLEKAINFCIAKLLAEVRDIRDGYVRKVLEIFPGNRAPEGGTTAGMQALELIP